MTDKIKLQKEIRRLCEKQYRKGFQHGFHASEQKRVAKEHVDAWRMQGSEELYSKCVDPHDPQMKYLDESKRVESELQDMPFLERIFE